MLATSFGVVDTTRKNIALSENGSEKLFDFSVQLTFQIVIATGVFLQDHREIPKLKFPSYFQYSIQRLNFDTLHCVTGLFLPE